MFKKNYRKVQYLICSCTNNFLSQIYYFIYRLNIIVSQSTIYKFINCFEQNVTQINKSVKYITNLLVFNFFGYNVFKGVEFLYN